MSLLKRTLSLILKEPIIILMLGDWRTGKTDCSLLISYLAKKWGLIDKIGSNIYTYDSPHVDYVISVQTVLSWLHRDKSEKLFILDEGLKHAYRRKAMSQKNIDIITEILPELSKGHGRVIVCSQIEKLDSDLLHPAFCRARIIKDTKKVMRIFSVKWKGARRFTNLPKSPIPFDPDRIAKFIDTKMSKDAPGVHGGRLYEIARMRADKRTNRQIADRFKIAPQQVKREYRKIMKFFVDYCDSLEDSRDFVNELEKAVIQE